jgi:hypothetical protein
VHANGKNYPYVSYDLDFGRGRATRAYIDLWLALGANSGSTAGAIEGPDISLERWLDGWTFFVVPMTSTLDDSGGFELIKSGTTTVHLKFSEPIPIGGVEMLMLGEFDQLFMIDESRKVVSDTQIT